MSDYKPKAYWEERISKSPNLEGVGYHGRGAAFNQVMYRAKRRAMQRGLYRAGIVDLNGKQILDMGAGTGFWINFFLEQGAAHCTGVDITDRAVELLQERFAGDNTTFLRSDIAAPNLTEKVGHPVDILTAIDVLYHVVDDNLLQKTLDNVAGLVAGGGWFIFSDVIFASKQSEGSYVYWRSLEAWQTMLAAHGFSLHFYVPMYVFLHPGISGPAWLRGLVNYVHGRLTPRLSRRKGLGPLYLWSLGMLDAIPTRIGGTSMYMVFCH